MIVEKIAGNIASTVTGNRKVDLLQLEWYEMTKRIQRKHTQDGLEIAIKFLKEGQRLQHGDILYMDDEKVVVVDILPSDAIVVTPRSLLEMGSICYEIGNKHLPVFIQNDQVLIPFEEPIFRWLAASGYDTVKAHTRLTNLLNANVQPHSHGGGSSLFSKILGMAAKER
ncbi:urease accessory protein UreE [Chitinophaga polysaccharea]|uniref:urease accessory protein UreE n=1 Tax=Chitinophaga TaxID=79328 RepID=UPI001454F0DB|nr:MULTISPECIES: urease accessory protein UreE [Chitinophaga]NLR61394.1 urease accessory protein UreE [Chitinophaga polysaccharea]NLU95229.1 urease accessory protein UreE [Chitinophaga sp. Ak27]